MSSLDDNVRRLELLESEACRCRKTDRLREHVAISHPRNRNRVLDDLRTEDSYNPYPDFNEPLFFT